jgi:hypothetical protein
MQTRRAGISSRVLLAALTLVAGCRGDVDPTPVETAPPGEGAIAYRYNREYVFVATRSTAVVIAPFTFRATDSGDALQRVGQAWLARGTTWDRFLDASHQTSRAGGVWRIVPVGPLRVIAGGPVELEALRYDEGERRLRLDFEPNATGWNQGGDTSFRSIEGRLWIGAESFAGRILEVLHVDQAQPDGWPRGRDADLIYLVAGDTLQMVLSGGPAPDAERYAWIRQGAGDRLLAPGEIRRVETRPLQEARRDVPRRWSVDLVEAGMRVELEALGSDAVVGPERGGRRTIEVRYAVTGTLTTIDAEATVSGMVLHTQ